MKLAALLIFWVSMSFAHEGHQTEMKKGEPLPGASIYHLQSEWKNQNGEVVKLENLRGKPRLVVMLYTKCATSCPLIVDDLKELGKDIDVSLFSLDSAGETPATLSEFAKKRRLPSSWGLFTSKSSSVAELAAVLGVRYKRLKNGDYIHSNVIYLLNESGEIRATKEGIGSSSEEFMKNLRNRS